MRVRRAHCGDCGGAGAGGDGGGGYYGAHRTHVTGRDGTHGGAVCAVTLEQRVRSEGACAASLSVRGCVCGLGVRGRRAAASFCGRMRPDSPTPQPVTEGGSVGREAACRAHAAAAGEAGGGV
jgi:hypothetical protein